MKPEFYIVVDIEASGPSPCKYSMLSLGAATLTDQPDSFYVEIKPDKEGCQQESMDVHGLSFQELKTSGTDPKAALESFAAWVRTVTPADAYPIFCAFNAPFDWMYVNDYFHCYLGYNPFGHKALVLLKHFIWDTAAPPGEKHHTRQSAPFITSLKRFPTTPVRMPCKKQLCLKKF